MYELEEWWVASCRSHTGDHPVSYIGVVIHGDGGCLLCSLQAGPVVYRQVALYDVRWKCRCEVVH